MERIMQIPVELWTPPNIHTVLLLQCFWRQFLVGLESVIKKLSHLTQYHIDNYIIKNSIWRIATSEEVVRLTFPRLPASSWIRAYPTCNSRCSRSSTACWATWTSPPSRWSSSTPTSSRPSRNSSRSCPQYTHTHTHTHTQYTHNTHTHTNTHTHYQHTPTHPSLFSQGILPCAA